jgi:hypothetical protein
VDGDSSAYKLDIEGTQPLLEAKHLSWTTGKTPKPYADAGLFTWSKAPVKEFIWHVPAHGATLTVQPGLADKLVRMLPKWALRNLGRILHEFHENLEEHRMDFW